MGRVIRGLYGPSPVDVTARSTRFRNKARLWYAAFAGRLLPRRPLIRELTEAELDLIRAQSAEAKFQVWLPQAVPVNYSVVGVDVAPYSRDVVTIRFFDGLRGRFEISQRKSWLPLQEELLAARIPFDRIPIIPGPAYLMHGKYGGEPIDLSFWTTRRAFVFECQEVRVECREVIGQGPGLPALLELVATHCQRPTRGVHVAPA